MNKILSILIIEDEEEVCDRYVDCIKPLEYFNIVSITNDSAKGIELTTSRKPDIVILDLELQRGSGSGLSYMAWYRDCYIENKPIVVITTHNPGEHIHKAVRNMGADFIFTKFADNYSETFVIEQLKIIADNLTIKKSSERSLNVAMSKEQDIERYKHLLFDEFNKIGLSPKLNGYKYLADAVIIYKMSVTKNSISKELSDKYKKTASSIERAMQRAIETTWSRSSIDELFEHYKGRISHDSGIPSNLEFISYYARKLDLL